MMLIQMLKIYIQTFAVLMFALPCYSKTTEMKKNEVQIIEFKNLPRIGSYQGQDIVLGGFSSLEIVSATKAKIKFRTVTDRGPNAPVIESDPKLGKNLRPFLISDYSPLIVDFEFNAKNEIQNLNTTNLYFNESEKITGLPTVEQTEANENRVEQALFENKKIKSDAKGFDVEGLCTDKSKRTWISEEYLPSIAVFDQSKKLIKRLNPEADFPSEYAKRKTNRGFEGLACDSKYAYAMLQSPIPLEKSVNKKTIRILRIDLKTLKAKDQFAYPLSDEKVDKVGDIAFDKDGNLYVLEQNGKLGSKSKRFIYKMKISDKKSIPLTENPEMWAEQDIEKKSLEKTLVKDLSAELSDLEKIEGLAIAQNKIFMIMDNDFGLAELENHQFKIDATQTPRLIWFELDAQKAKKGK
jgi:hypothetical protein